MDIKFEKMIKCENDNDYNMILEYLTMIIFMKKSRMYQIFNYSYYKIDEIIKCNMDYLHILDYKVSDLLGIELRKNKLMNEYYTYEYNMSLSKVVPIMIELNSIIYNIVKSLMKEDKIKETIKYTHKSYNNFINNVLYDHYLRFNEDDIDYYDDHNGKYNDNCKKQISFAKSIHLFSLCRMTKYMKITRKNKITIENIKNTPIYFNCEYMLNDDIKIENIQHILGIKDLSIIIIEYIGVDRSNLTQLLINNVDEFHTLITAHINRKSIENYHEYMKKNQFPKVMQ